MASATARQQLPFNEQLKTAGQLVCRARDFYDIWWFYDGTETRPAIIDTMNEYSGYFRSDQHAHFVSFVIHIAALFDGKRKDVISLPRLVKVCARTGGFPKAVIKEAEALLAKARVGAESATVLRHNLFAHRSATISYKQAFKEAAVTPNQLAQLTDTGLCIINRLLAANGQNERDFTPLPLEHAKAMMTALTSKLAQRL